MKFYNLIKGEGFLDPSTLQGAVVLAAICATSAWLIGFLLRATVQRVLARDKHDHFDRMAFKFLAKLLRYCVYIFAFVAYAHLVPSLSSLGTASLTSISVITVIVGLAAQNTLGNLVAGISLLLYRPFRLGDRLQVMAPTGVETGVVESLTLGYTLLRTDDNRRVVVPNSVMGSQTTVNLTGDDPRVLCSVAVGISYDSDIDRARGILLALAAAHPKGGGVNACPLTRLSNAGIELTLEVWCVDALTAITLRCDLLEEAIKRFGAEGIGIPQPSSLVVLRDDRRVAAARVSTTPRASGPPTVEAGQPPSTGREAGPPVPRVLGRARDNPRD